MMFFCWVMIFTIYFIICWHTTGFGGQILKFYIKFLTLFLIGCFTLNFSQPFIITDAQRFPKWHLSATLLPKYFHIAMKRGKMAGVMERHINCAVGS